MNVALLMSKRTPGRLTQSMATEALRQICVTTQFTFSLASTVDYYQFLPSAKIQYGPKP